MGDVNRHAARARARRRRPNTLTQSKPSGAFGYIGFEEAQGKGVVGIPIEAYKFVQGSTVWRFTSSDRNVTLSDGTFLKSTIGRDAIDFSQEDTAENVSIKVPRTNAVARLFVSFNPPTAVTVTIFRKHRSDPEEIVIFVGKVMNVQFAGPEATLICAPISQAFRRRVPSLVFQSHCNWALYGGGCGVAAASFKDGGTVSSVAGVLVGAAIFGTRADGWYNNGWLEVPATGERRYVLNHFGSFVEIHSPIPALAIGAAIDIFAGCDRTEATCASKFNNLVNHLGWPRIPTRNPYSGSII